MDVTLQAVKRGDKGKNEARRHRAAGRLPAIVYGRRQCSRLPVTVEPKALSRILHSDSGANTLITLRVEGESETRVLVKEYQLDPITHDLLHADFYRVAMDRAIHGHRAHRAQGRGEGCQAAGRHRRLRARAQIELECLPGDIPEHIDVDVTELMMNDGVRVRDLATGGKWTSVSEPDTLIVHVVALVLRRRRLLTRPPWPPRRAPRRSPRSSRRARSDKEEEKA